MSFPRYPSYKDSGVEWLGEVPGHWDVTLSKRFLTVQSGDMINSSEEMEIGYPLIGGNGIRAYTNKSNTSGDTLVIGRVGAKCGCVHHINEDFWASEHAFRVIEKQPLSKRFFFHLLSAIELNKFAIKTAQPLLNTEIVETQWISVPPLREQTQIAAFLDRETAKIDALVAEQRRLMELLKEKRQAVISHAVTKGLNPNAPMKPSGIEWLGDVPEHWETTTVKRLVATFEQGWSPQCEGFPVENEKQWGVLKVGCVNGGTFKPEENKALPPELEPIPSLGIAMNDLLISRANTRELVGGAAVARQNYANLLLCDKLYRLRFSHGVCDAEFIALYLSTGMARGQIELAATGASSSMVNIAQSTILEMELALPEFQEQQLIVTFLKLESARFDTLNTESQHAIDLLQERRTALISAAITGQIDVRDRQADQPLQCT